MNLVKQASILLVTGVVAVGGYLGWQMYEAASGGSAEGKQSEDPLVVAVEVAKAEPRKIDTIVEAVGTTRAVRSVKISPLSSGRVVEVGFKVGERVDENAVLLRLDAEVQRVNLAEAEAKLKEANSALRRSTILKRQSAVSEAAVERLIAASEIAKAERDRADKELRDRVVHAPFAGSIGFSDVEPGALVKEGEVIAVLDDLSSVEIEFAVPEGLFGKLKIGDKVQARATPFPDRVFIGTISAVDTRIDNISRAFKVRGLIANEDEALPAGMFVHVSIILDGADALAIPEEAVVVDGSRAFVFVVVQGDDPKMRRVEQRLVTTGRRSFGFVEIKQGVALNEEVVIRGVQKVRDRALVRIGKPGKENGHTQSKKPEMPAKKPASSGRPAG